MNLNGQTPSLDDVRRVLERDGKRPVLLYIEKGIKYPAYKNWQQISFPQTQTPLYQKCLQQYCNTGVLLGVCDNLCTIDADTEFMFAETIALNPGFASSLISQGERAGQIWLYVTGARPRKVEPLKVRKDSPLALGAKKIEDDGTVKVGEFRAEGGQSVIRGIHPCGCHYRWRSPGPPITIDFKAIIWHPDIIIPWGRDYRTRQQTTGNADDDNLLRRAIDALTVDRLWQHFGYPERTTNPVCSPFRNDQHPSFSVYDEGRRWKDHGNGAHGDSFDFFAQASGQNPKEAFVQFVELAGLGSELRKNKGSSKSSPAATGALQKIVEALAIYYDPERACFWMQDSRGNWIKINENSVTRHLEDAGYDSRKGKNETISETGRILNAIQLSMDVEYAGSLAGYTKGILQYCAKRFLILDSPRLIEPKPGDWPILRQFLENLLDGEHSDQIIYFNGWMKVSQESLRSHNPRPAQALAFIGEKDCGKSLLQSLITEILGGRVARPYLYMSGQTTFNGNLFGTEHLAIEDEQPCTDIKSRRAFGTRIKEITAIDDQNCHKKFRDGITLPVFWRLTISVNDETENLMILPPFDDSISDKLMIFRVHKHPMPMLTSTIQERLAFRAALSAELPAFIYYLLYEWAIEPALVSQRYGITHYQDSDIVRRLRELAPETRLLQLIDAEIFKPVQPIGPRTDPWEGTSLALEQWLTHPTSDVRRQACDLLSWQGACGTYLGRLRKQQPNRVSMRKKHPGDRIWTVSPPPVAP